MTKLLINYADRAYYLAQQVNKLSGLKVAGFERAITYRREHLDPRFVERNREVLSEPFGAGCWLWKPYIVVNTLHNEMSEGDVLFYCDSGCRFIGSLDAIIERCVQQADKPILLFQLDPSYSNRKYTKRDCFHYMGLDEPFYADATQTLASFFVCQKTAFTVRFFEEWLRFAEDRRILTDAPNQCGLPNYPDFFEHRYDQSILSLLGRKHGIAAIPDISQYGNTYRPVELPQLIDHSRWKE
jgi:hypothetical protein